MAGSGFMILCFQSPPQARHKMGEANLGTPPRRKAFQKNTTHRQKPHTKKTLQSLTNLHKKCSFSHINAYLCNNFYKNQQSYN